MVEFRLYYDDTGKVICYTCDNLPGKNYIVIDKDVFAQSRPDVRVFNGKIENINDRITVSKMVISNKGSSCEIDDICILTDEEPNLKWEIQTHEYRNS